MEFENCGINSCCFSGLINPTVSLEARAFGSFSGCSVPKWNSLFDVNF